MNRKPPTEPPLMLAPCVLGSDCRVHVNGMVYSGEQFDMWRESWSRDFDMPAGERVVFAHRECNDRADHSKDGV